MGLFGGALGGVVGGATVKLFLDKSQFEAGLAQARGETEAGATTMGKFSGAAKAAFATAGVAVVAFGASSVKAFMESQQVTAEFQNTLSQMPKLAGQTTDAFQAQATALEHLTGFQDEEVLSADNVLARFSLTADQMKQAIPIVLDYARATGQDATSAAQSIGKALLGNTRALKTVGIDYKVTGNAATDFSNILGALNNKVGGTANTFGKTLAGQIEIAKAKLDDFKETVGGFIASGLLALTGNVDAAAQMWVKLGDSTAGADKALAHVLQTGIEANKTLSEIVASPAADAMDTVAAAAGKLAAADQRAADATRNLYLAQLSLAGGLVGLAADEASSAKAKADLSAAQNKVNTLTENGKKGTAAYTQAVRDRNAAELTSIQSQLTLKNDAQNLFAEFKKGNVTLAQADAQLRSQAQAAGLSAGQTQNLVDKVNALYTADKKVPGSVTTNFNAPGLESQMAQLQHYWMTLDSIPTHKDVTIVTHYQTIGAPGGAGGPA